MIILWPMTTILTFNKNFLAITGNANRECLKRSLFVREHESARARICDSMNFGACSVRISAYNMQAAERYGEYYG